ncbi:MAG: hypothetical protein HN476_06220, partial [Porticoccaceae bacterium]|nr:hypothetical protein [Porticoccaceae bacterium]
MTILSFNTPTIGAEMTGLQIMQMMEDAQRATNDSSFTRLKLSSCKFGVNKGRIACA